jgi:RNA polymerase sigma factor FliA
MDTVLTQAELDELWTEWRASGDPAVRERLICHYLPVVDFLARRAARSVPQAHRPDLHGFGVLGLMDAIDKFRPELGHRFETYGSRRIRGAMSDGIRSLNWLPRRADQAASRIISKVVTVDFQTARTAVGTRLEDCLTDPEAAQVPDGLDLEADHAEVMASLSVLPERERFVIEQHYYRRRRLADIGAEMGVTESRVCQLHRRALSMMRDVLTAQLSA